MELLESRRWSDPQFEREFSFRCQLRRMGRVERQPKSAFPSPYCVVECLIKPNSSAIAVVSATPISPKFQSGRWPESFALEKLKIAE
jgi:hypothetical protein